MVKWWGPKAVDAIHDCLLLHGHWYTQDLPLEQRLRDVIGLEIGDGTAQVSKIVIARELFGRVPALSVSGYARYPNRCRHGCSPVEGTHERLPSDR